MMDMIHELDAIAASITKATEKLESRAEKMSFLHQTLLSVSNILDLEENSLQHSLTSPRNASQTPSRNLGSKNSSLILRLHNQRLALQRNPTADLQRAHFLSVTQDGEKDTLKSESVSSAMHNILSSLEDLCNGDWKWIKEESANHTSAVDEIGDPLAKECYNVGKESRTFAIQYLKGVQDRCKKLTEQEKLLRSRLNANEQSSVSNELNNENRLLVSDLEECIWRIEGRLHGYEGNFKNNWITFYFIKWYWFWLTVCNYKNYMLMSLPKGIRLPVQLCVLYSYTLLN